MQKWEYKTVYHWVEGEEMGSLGEEGWELVTVIEVAVATDTKGHAFFFKRPKS